MKAAAAAPSGTATAGDTPAAAAPAKTAAAAKSAKPAPAEPAPAPVAETTARPAKQAPAPTPVFDDWTTEELDDIRQELLKEAAELHRELDEVAQHLDDSVLAGADRTGDDQADAGTATFEREHEMSLAANSREMLAQVERALTRLDNNAYGACESCGKPIGKERLQAFPRATLCKECKQREERR